MDVEKTIEFILEQQANIALQQAKADQTINRVGHRLDRAVKLGIREVRNERERRLELDVKLTAAQARLTAAQAEQAAAGAALDEKMTRLAASQLLTEEKFRGFEEKWESFMDFMRRGNGSH